MKNNGEEALWTVLNIRDKTIEKIKSQLIEKEAAIQQLSSAINSCQALQIEKENIIQELKNTNVDIADRISVHFIIMIGRGRAVCSAC